MCLWQRIYFSKNGGGWGEVGSILLALIKIIKPTDKQVRVKLALMVVMKTMVIDDDDNADFNDKLKVNTAL